MLVKVDVSKVKQNSKISWGNFPMSVFTERWSGPLKRNEPYMVRWFRGSTALKPGSRGSVLYLPYLLGTIIESIQPC